MLGRILFGVRFDAPDQVVHGVHCRLPFGRLLTVLKARQQQHFAPGFLHKLHHHLRQYLAQQRIVQCLFDPASRQFGLGPAFFGIAGALFQKLAAAALISSEGQKLGQQFREDHRVIDKIIQQPLDHLLDAQVQAVALMIITLPPTQCCGGDLIKQAAGRVVATAEETFVQHRNLEHRDLQTADQHLERVRQGSVIKDELKQHGDQVDHIFIGHPNHTRLAALDADPREQLLKLVTQVEVILGNRRHVLLQVREQAQQVTCRNRLGFGAGFKGRGNAATHLQQQLLQGSENFLHALVELRAARQSLGFNRGYARTGGTVCRAPGGARHQFRQDTGGNQQLVGFGVQLVGVAEHITFKQFEDDQLDLDLHPQAAPGLQKVLTEQRRPQRVAALCQMLTEQCTQAGGQLPQGQPVAFEHPGHHGVHGQGPLQFVAT